MNCGILNLWHPRLQINGSSSRVTIEGEETGVGRRLVEQLHVVVG